MKSKSGRLKETNQSGERVLKAEALRRKGAHSPTAKMKPPRAPRHAHDKTMAQQQAGKRPAAASIPQARGKRGPRLARRYGKTSSSMLRLSQLSAKTDSPA
mgnify:CR=1 FL=1